MLQIVNFSRKNIKMYIKVVGYCGHYRLSVVCVRIGRYVCSTSTSQMLILAPPAFSLNDQLIKSLPKNAIQNDFGAF